MRWCRELGIYIYCPVTITKYVELTNGKVVRRDEIPDDHYEILKEWGEIKREFRAERR